MSEFNIGDYIEVGMGDNIYDEDGWSYFFRIDLEGYNELDIFNLFIEEGNVLYIEVVEDEGAILFAGDKKLSDFLSK